MQAARACAEMDMPWGQNICAFLSIALLAAAGVIFSWTLTLAQRAPSAAEIAGYSGLHAAAHQGDIEKITKLIAAGASLNETDGHGRTPMHVAAFASHEDAVRRLATGGGDPNILEADRYDIITIAAVADDNDMLVAAIDVGGNPSNITSIYDGTALIAAAHLGHHQVVQTLIEAGAPLDHINNLGWTALIEAVILGDGKERHIKTVRALVKAGADRNIADRNGATPLDHARQRGYQEMVKILSGTE
ncbi:MAG: ankyrin repeat domain-containing protein [Hyphomicrobiales bacterium]